MSVQEIRSAIAELPTDELASLGEWMDKYRADAWDRQIAQDVDAGRLDALAEQANREFEAGLARPLQTPCHKHHAINGTANQRGR